MSSPPTLDDYVRLFAAYGEDISSVYLKPSDTRYELLFEQAARLLVQPSKFNQSLPKPFRVTAHNYLAGDEKTVRHMNYPENRHFMLSDLYDFIVLKAAQQKRIR
ncbi:MAG: hypothetical protein NUV50_14660 [Rhodospirillales bacterium]|nr:hypothetical protein [Rhodospirillales bacterium]